MGGCQGLPLDPPALSVPGVWSISWSSYYCHQGGGLAPRRHGFIGQAQRCLPCGGGEDKRETEGGGTLTRRETEGDGTLVINETQNGFFVSVFYNDIHV